MSQIRRFLRVLGQLLLAMVAIVGTALVFRWLLYPALLWVFDPGPGLATQFRRFGILLSATLGYWLYVRFLRKRAVAELRPAVAGAAIGSRAGGSGGRAARVGLGGGDDHGAGAQGEDDGGGQREEVLGVHCHASVVMLLGGVVVR